MQEYVAGFLFRPDYRGAGVALIMKNRPDWQRGKLNGIGGHIEPGETPAQAMEREFLEETGARVTGWKRFAIYDFPEARVHFFSARSSGVYCRDSVKLRSCTDERVNWYQVSHIPALPTIRNLNWLIPMALYRVPRPGEGLGILREMSDDGTDLSDKGTSDDTHQTSVVSPGTFPCAQ